MDDLIAFLHGLLAGDSALATAFSNAGGTNGVDVADQDNRTTAAYPRIVLTGDEGSQMQFGENDRPQFFDGVVRIEIVVRQVSEAVQSDPLASLYAIRDRLTDLLLGNDTLNLHGVRGTTVSANWTCTRFRQREARRLPSVDPVFKRHETVYAVQLCRLGI